MCWRVWLLARWWYGASVGCGGVCGWEYVEVYVVAGMWLGISGCGYVGLILTVYQGPLCLSMYLFVCLCIYLFVYVSVYMTVCVCIYLSVYLSMCMSIYLIICASVYLPI